MKRLLSLILLLGSIAMLAGCPNRTTVRQLNADPGHYYNREIVLQGVIVSSFGALGIGAYELDDETGRIWVLTERGVPIKGSRVKLVGKLIQGMTWGGRNYGNAVRETGRRP